jgi:hypothetical protein
MIPCLLDQLGQYSIHIAKVIVTYNIPCVESFCIKEHPFEVVIIDNEKPIGFGANHNQAFLQCETEYFCIMNPDIQLMNDPFDALLTCDANPAVAAVAPKIINLQGATEDSARYFPTPWGLVGKLFGLYDGVFPVREDREIEYPDCLAGMFLLVNANKFSQLGGFDKRFYLYYEDFDFCARAWQEGFGVALCQSSIVIHDARRASHRDGWFFKLHFKSVVRFFWKHLGRFPKGRH